jgi:hypothetical protein
MYKIQKKSFWNQLDAIALLNGISTWDDQYLNLKYTRLPGETNLDLRNKIINTFENTVSGNTVQDIINGLSAELNLISYNVLEKRTFNLSNIPEPSGLKNEQDIWVSYQPVGDSGWYDIVPQRWSDTVYVDKDTRTTQSSGFIVWQNEYHDVSQQTVKTHTYFGMLHILDNLPDQSSIKVTYHRRIYNQDGSYNIFPFTEILEDKFRYPEDITTSDLTNKIVAYSLNDIPSGLYDIYYTGVHATSQLFAIRDDIIRQHDFRWAATKNRTNIWDIEKTSDRSVIPSFYDGNIVIPSGFIYKDFDNKSYLLTGGLEHQSDSLYLEDIVIETSGNIEYWYPVIHPGRFYVNGTPYLLMQNPTSTSFIPISITQTLSSFPQRGDSVLLGNSNKYTVINNNQFFEAYNKTSINYPDQTVIETFQTSGVYRERPYLTADKGITITLNTDEFALDYDTNTVYLHSSLIGQDLTLIWDTPFGSGVVYRSPFADLNPLNYDFIDEKYFLFLE